MNFDDWIVTIPDGEKDTLCLMDAWRVGAAQMVEHLFSISRLDEDYKKKIINETVEALINKENNHG